jgi:predicted O-methyltransferase YrrM
MDKLFSLMESYAAEQGVPIINRESLALLLHTVVDRQPQSILEIGTAIGYSTLKMSAAAPVEAIITTIEIDPERANLAENYFHQAGLASRVNLLVGDAAEILPTLHDRYDMVFIDAAKGQYHRYLRQILPNLEPGAVVFADNILFRGWVLGGDPPRRYRTIVKRLREYLDFVTNDGRFTTVLHKTGDGVAISQYRGETVS